MTSLICSELFSDSRCRDLTSTTNVANSSRLDWASLPKDSHNARAREPAERTAERHDERHLRRAVRGKSNTTLAGNRRIQPAGPRERPPNDPQNPGNDCGFHTSRQCSTDATQPQTHGSSGNHHRTRLKRVQLRRLHV